MKGKTTVKALLVLALLIVTCAVISRKMTGKETLSEYAKKNPDVAYATKEPSASPDADGTAEDEMESVASPATEENSDAADSASESVEDTFVPAAIQSADAISPYEGFFYQPLTYAVIQKITGTSYPAAESEAPEGAVNVVADEEIGNLAISYDDLRYLQIRYVDFDGETQTGELICNQEVAADLIDIFYELYRNAYQLESVRLIDDFSGDDIASMQANNTSCFNYRVIAGTSRISNHAYGCAIDINPFYNPYVIYDRNGTGEDYVSPPGSEAYIDRSVNFPYKIDETDLCYQLFIERGFTWGGNWNSCKDYQHFERTTES